jgi:UDP-GlcNAc:undecaprenyl-phosphate GlcNAc-1-phosphate transferase
MSLTQFHTFVALCIGAAVSAALTPAVRFLAMKTGCYAVPLRDRWHRSKPIPLLGGFAIIGGSAAGLVMLDEWRSLVPLAVCSGLMATLGAVDDFVGVRPSMKLIVQMLVAGILLLIVTPPNITGSVIVDQLLAFTWIVGITNAFNLLDNMDGLSAGVATIAGAGYLALVLQGGSALAVPVAAFVGATAGFLLHNFPPASIFMGDSGSFFLGSFLAGVGLMIAPSLERPSRVALVPMLILLVPIFDTVFVTYTRKRAGRAAMIGGRDHTSHRLVALGVSERTAVLTLYSLAAAGALLAFGVGRLPLGSIVAVVGLYSMLVMAIGIVLGNTGEYSPEAESTVAAPLISEVAYRRRIYQILADTGLLAIAYYAAFRIRFQGPDFDTFFPPFVRTLPTVLGVQVAGLYLAGKYRQMWRSVSAAELGTLIKGLALGVTGSVLFVLIGFRFERFSRGVFIIDALVAWFLLVGTRAVTSGIDDYLRRARVRGARVLVYGAGRGGSLLVRELLQNRSAGCVPVGFIDDDPRKWRVHVEGIPVLGDSSQMAAIVARHAITEILISIRDMTPGRVSELLAECTTLGVRLRRMRFSIDDVRPPGILRHDQHNSRGA